MPITTRQLESLLRLAEARAKIELSEMVTREHALDVIALMRASIFEAATDELGQVDFGRLSGGMSKGKAVTALIAAVRRRAAQTGARATLARTRSHIFSLGCGCCTARRSARSRA